MTAADRKVGLAASLLTALLFGEVVAVGVDGPLLATIAAMAELIGGALILLLLRPALSFWRSFAVPLLLAILAWAWIASPTWFAVDPFGRHWSAPDLLPQASVRFLGGIAVMTSAAAIGWRRGGVRLTIDRWLVWGLLNIALALVLRHYNPDAVWGIDKGDLRDRFTGTFLNANAAGCYFAVLAVLAMGRGFALALDRSVSAPFLAQVATPIAFLGGLGACAITGSRTALFAALVALILLAAQFGPQWMRQQRGNVRALAVGVGVIVLLLLVFLLLGEATLDRLALLGEDWTGRTDMWALYGRLVAQAPLGYGPGGFDDAALHGFASIHEAHVAWYVHSAHNVILSLLMTGGYPYLAMMVALVVALLFPFFRRAHRMREPVVVATVVALGLILVCASTDIALDMPALAAMSAMLAGLIWGRASRFVTEARVDYEGMRPLTNGSAGEPATSPSA
ncbi:O-antigen ligase family protein [Sphingomonas fuzhouensis]|uniref:O-antigen ligase family protein n=1 Tax=Sphingomonas fuzhouensis TaxID=3106033 RepID=UPI002AFF1441|nr:O-antigen ligase family protein [Sphingomonas sp. SGZ-02]